MKRIFATLILACALSVSAHAGEIPTCSPAPPAAMTTSEVQPVTGEIPTADSSMATSESEASVLTDLLLTLVGLMVS
jgi:hypothetical protein